MAAKLNNIWCYVRDAGGALYRTAIFENVFIFYWLDLLSEIYKFKGDRICCCPLVERD